MHQPPSPAQEPLHPSNKLKLPEISPFAQQIANLTIQGAHQRERMFWILNSSNEKGVHFYRATGIRSTRQATPLAFIPGVGKGYFFIKEQWRKCQHDRPGWMKPCSKRLSINTQFLTPAWFSKDFNSWRADPDENIWI